MFKHPIMKTTTKNQIPAAILNVMCNGFVQNKKDDARYTKLAKDLFGNLREEALFLAEIGRTSELRKHNQTIVNGLRNKYDIMIYHGRVTALGSKEIDGCPGAHQSVDVNLPTGGQTFVYLVKRATENTEAEVVFRGKAICSDKDAFNRALGVYLALLQVKAYLSEENNA